MRKDKRDWMLLGMYNHPIGPRMRRMGDGGNEEDRTRTEETARRCFGPGWLCHHAVPATDLSEREFVGAISCGRSSRRS